MLHIFWQLIFFNDHTDPFLFVIFQKAKLFYYPKNLIKKSWLVNLPFLKSRKFSTHQLQTVQFKNKSTLFIKCHILSQILNHYYTFLLTLSWFLDKKVSSNNLYEIESFLNKKIDDLRKRLSWIFDFFLPNKRPYF